MTPGRPESVPRAASIVVVTHRGPDAMLRRCLDSLAAGSGAEVRVLVVDNSAAPLHAASDYGPGVDDVVRVENRGFGAAANSGFQLALADSSPTSGVPVAVLNDDIEVDPGWLEPLLAALDTDASLGAVQPALLRYGTDRVNSLGVELDRFGAGSDVGLGRRSELLRGSVPIDIFTGGAVMFRPAFVHQTGGFDERYFLYYEDVDLALRGAEAGWRYRCETASRVHHHGGASITSLGDDVIGYRERNRLWIAARFGSARTVAEAVWLSVRRLRHRPRLVHARALATGLFGIPGARIRRASAQREVPVRRR